MSQMSQMSQGAASARWNEIEEERAAIFEHDGKIPRTWAEGYARLHPDHPLADVPPKRWQQFIDDIGRFLDAGWAEKASALGWSGGHYTKVALSVPTSGTLSEPKPAKPEPNRIR